MSPYTYHVYHIPTSAHYYGVRCGNKCSPQEDLWNKYFTSSKKIKSLIGEYGKSTFKVEVRKVFPDFDSAYSWERRVLSKLKVLSRSDWLNENIGGELFTGSLGGTSATFYGKKHSQETINYLKQINLGQKNPMYGRSVSDEQRFRISLFFKSFKRTESHNKNIGNSLRGKKKSFEHVSNMSSVRIGKNLAGKNPNSKWIYKIKDPGGIVYLTACLKQFCQNMHLNYSGMCSMTSEKSEHCDRWSLISKERKCL